MTAAEGVDPWRDRLQQHPSGFPAKTKHHVRPFPYRHSCASVGSKERSIPAKSFSGALRYTDDLKAIE